MDGETKQVNQELETYLRLFSTNKPEEWSNLLPMVEFAHNSATHSITQRTPFSLMMGYKPRAYPPPMWNPDSLNSPLLAMMLRPLTKLLNRR